MICLQVVYLFLEDFRPEILADKLDCLKMVTEAWPLHCIPNKIKIHREGCNCLYNYKMHRPSS